VPRWCRSVRAATAVVFCLPGPRSGRDCPYSCSLRWRLPAPSATGVGAAATSSVPLRCPGVSLSPLCCCVVLCPASEPRRVPLAPVLGVGGACRECWTVDVAATFGSFLVLVLLRRPLPRSEPSACPSRPCSRGRGGVSGVMDGVGGVCRVMDGGCRGYVRFLGIGAAATTSVPLRTLGVSLSPLF
jgi:hypothetical protein